jgi:hypothetical protein
MRSTGTRSIVDNNLLTKGLRHLLGDDPCNGVIGRHLELEGTMQKRDRPKKDSPSV